METTGVTAVGEYFRGLDEPQRHIGEAMQSIIDAALPDAVAAVWHGHPVWGLGPKPGHAPICLLKAYPRHMTFALWRGQLLDDPTGRLVPGAREMASIKLRNAADIDEPFIARLLVQARELVTDMR